MFWNHVDDIVAGAIVVGCFLVIFFSRDCSEAWALLGAAAAWCFRSGIESRRNNK
jgi:hypothetical protein